MQIHLDGLGGVSGDMFIAAVLDAFPTLRGGMLESIRAAGLPEAVTCRIAEYRDHALTGLRFLVDEPEQVPRFVLGRDHRHTPFREIRDRLQGASIGAGAKERAIQIFALLAEVEGQVHGVPAEDVSFHELGGWDSIADIVGAAHLIDALGAERWTVSPLPQGSGRVKTEHGVLPVPTPATARLLEGFLLVADGLQGERVTPTGAAILRHVNAAQQNAAHQIQPRRLLHSGHGFGTKTFPGISNVLRLLAFEDAAPPAAPDHVAQIEFEVDDQTGEDLAIALDHLRALPGVLDVVQIPALGKKGRMTAHIQILVDPAHAETLCQACFRETATLGLRMQTVERRVLPRSHSTVEVAGRVLRVKVAERPGVHTAKVESDDLQIAKGGRAERQDLRQAAEQAGLAKERR